MTTKETRDKLRQDVIDDSLNIVNPSQAKLVGFGFDMGLGIAIAQADRLAEALKRQLSSTSHYRSSGKNPNPEMDEARCLSETLLAEYAERKTK